MFDKLIRDLKKYEHGVRIPISLPLDDEGYLDRRCPEPTCHAEFKVLFQDWEAKVSDEKVYCPICRGEQRSTEWNTEQQAEYIKSVALTHLQGVINSGLREGARQFNRRQKPGFISMSMSIKPASPPVIFPIDAAMTMRRNFTCETCGCRYAAIGTAFFCPACGHNSVVATFDEALESVKQSVLLVPNIRATLTTAFDPDVAENSIRNMLEDSLGRLVGAFQQFSESLFEQLPNAANFKRRKNVFQNLAESSTLWKNAAGKGYEDMLSASEMQELGGLFQKRHLIAHRNGIVDQEYIDKSGDRTFAVGQRLVIKDRMVLRLAELLSKLSKELRQLV